MKPAIPRRVMAFRYPTAGAKPTQEGWQCLCPNWDDQWRAYSGAIAVQRCDAAVVGHIRECSSSGIVVQINTLTSHLPRQINSISFFRSSIYTLLPLFERSHSLCPFVTSSARLLCSVPRWHTLRLRSTTRIPPDCCLAEMSALATRPPLVQSGVTTPLTPTT